MSLKRCICWWLGKWHLITNRVRSWYWSNVCGSVGTGLRVTGKIWVDPPEKLIIGNDVVLNEGVYINTRDAVHIGDGTHVSAFAIIHTGSLDIQQVDRPHMKAPVVIGKHVWLATGVIVNPGVTIGDGCIVGAGAVVTRDLPPYTLCLGVPAKPIKDLPRP